MIRILAGALALGLFTAPLAAQTAPPPVAEEAIDPARLAAAGRLAALLVPEGIFMRMFSGMPGMESLMAMRPAELGAPAEPGAAADDGEPSFADLAAERDPHFQERMRITNQIMGEAMGEAMSAAEPEMRSVFARFFARRFTLPELDEMVAFFASATGRKYADVALTMTQDPAFLEMMTAMVPRFMQIGVGVEERIRAATAHLPPEPAPEAPDPAE